MRRTIPVGALCAGLAAGALGSLVQNLFFTATKKIAPQGGQDRFQPPEREQKDETATQTVARRTVEGLMQRGPISEEAKQRGGTLVHFAFGSAWGGLYGLLAGSSRTIATPAGGLGFGVAVWAASDNLILPAFKLSAPPGAYPLKTHAYAIAAHLVYGATLWASFEALRRIPWLSIAAAAGAAWSTRRLPRAVRAPLRKAVYRANLSGARVSSIVRNSLAP